MLPYSSHIRGACRAFPEKLRFATKQAALEYVKNNPIVTDKVRVYGCNDCHGFHFTHWSKNQYKAFANQKLQGDKLIFRDSFLNLLNRQP